MSQTPAAFPSPTTSSASSSSSVPMVVITVVGILAAFALLASYYAFVTRCQLLRALLAPWRGGGGVREDSSSSSAAVAAEASDERRRRGLGLPLIRMLPVVRFTAADGRRVSVSSECAVCLSEFAEKERVRLLPGCSHAFHIDCIDTWLQGSARCPFCRRSVTLPPMPLVPLPPKHGHVHGDYDDRRRRRDEQLVTSAGDGGDGAIVIEVRGERESWGVGGRKVQRKKAVGDEAVETRRRKDGGGEFAVEPMRRSLSMDSSSACCDKLYVSVDRPAAGAELAS